MHFNKMSILFNPYRRTAGFQALIIGISVVFWGGFIGYYTNTRFFGIFNIQTGIIQNKWINIIEPVVNILIISIWFIVICKIFSKKSFRSIDILGTQFFAFLPMLPISFLGCITSFEKVQIVKGIIATDINGYDIFIISISLLLVFLLILWSGTLMYVGLKISTNMSHKKTIPVFISGIIIIQIISSFLF